MEEAHRSAHTAQPTWFPSVALGAFIGWLALGVIGCGAGAPADRCAATTSALRGLEPACWYEAGAPAVEGDAGRAHLE